MNDNYEIKNSLTNYTKDPETSCWNYNTVTHLGDGVIKHKGWLINAHRHFYLHHIGMIPKGYLVRKDCDNPSCVNPDHLHIQEDLSEATDLVYHGHNFCSHPNCDKKHYSNTFCVMHNSRNQKGIDMNLPPKIQNRKPAKECSVDGCDIKPKAKGLCRLHYERDKKGKPLNKEMPKSAEDYGGLCSIEGCDKPYLAQGLCRTHYQRKSRNTVSLDAPYRNLLSPEDRFHQNYDIDKDTGCWVYRVVSVKGYGILNSDGKQVRAHRYSYELHKGPIPGGLVVMHSCDNPPCVNPEHLSVGTYQDNSDDMIAKGRGFNLKGELHPGAVLTEDQVLVIYKRTWEGNESIGDISKDYIVGPSSIWHIKHGKIWNHITNHIK